MPEPNYYSQLPYRNVFSQQYNPNPMMPGMRGQFGAASITPEEIQNPIPPVVRPQDPLRDRLNALYSNPSPALEQFTQHYNEMPQMSQYPPGKLAKVGAVLAGLGTGWSHGAGAGTEAARSIIEGPYRRAYQEWMNRGQGLGVRAELEDRNAQRQIAAVKAMMEQGDREREFEIKELTAKASMTSAQARMITAQRGDTVIVNDGASQWLVNKTDGSKIARISDAPQVAQRSFTSKENSLDRAGAWDRLLQGEGFTAKENELDRNAAAARQNQRFLNANGKPATPAEIDKAREVAKNELATSHPNLFAAAFDATPAAYGRPLENPPDLAKRNKAIELLNKYTYWVLAGRTGPAPLPSSMIIKR